ncbi:MAG TPA: ABC transporter ATP-binding protein [Burkholderiales bacterium]|nr:ABC transporter ATP-binding protein [Burkholderiales bacterium]
MAYLEIEQLAKSYGAARALQGVSFTAGQGEIVALLGPSGCGKTTLLNLIAGFIAPDAGTIRVGGRLMNTVPPHKRDMAMGFQNYALFPHLSVARNVAFGLEMRGVAKTERAQRVAEALELVHLAGLEDRYPRQLSGGQQQRVALARALVVRPSLLLLDEPLSNLDTLLRKTMRNDMREILRRAGTTVLIVTHDQEEALVMSDRILLLANGVIEQMGTPEDLFERPRTVFAAHFMDTANLIAGRISRADNGCVEVETGVGALTAERCGAAVGADVTVAIRPERIRLDGADGDNRVDGVVRTVNYLGTAYRLEVEAGGTTVVVAASAGGTRPQTGQRVSLSWRRCDTRVVEGGGAASQ